MKTRTILTTLSALAALAVSPADSVGQDVFQACYVPDVGALYLIQLADLPTSCLSEEHVEVSWTEGGGEGGISDHGELSGLPDDDHAQYLLTDGVRNAVSGFAVTGTFEGGGAIPLEGPGSRVMWYPDRAAFRAGSVTGEQWDAANVGEYSMALGVDVQASDIFTIALGNRAVAATFGSVALGNIVEATGNNSLATNVGTHAQGNASTAMGHTTVASGFTAVSMNEQTHAQGNNTLAVGKQTIARPTTSVAIGRWNTGNGNPNGWVDTDPLLMAGNGTSDIERSNALTLFKNGDLTIAGNLTESSDRRLKRDVRTLGPALESLMAIQPVRFRFKEGIGHPADVQIGLIAQEVESAFPELVTHDSEGYLSLAYPKLSAVLLKGLQEQQAQIDALRGEVAELRAQLSGAVASGSR